MKKTVLKRMSRWLVSTGATLLALFAHLGGNLVSHLKYIPEMEIKNIAEIDKPLIWRSNVKQTKSSSQRRLWPTLPTWKPGGLVMKWLLFLPSLRSSPRASLLTRD
jgi:hypothetical protein